MPAPDTFQSAQDGAGPAGRSEGGLPTLETLMSEDVPKYWTVGPQKTTRTPVGSWRAHPNGIFVVRDVVTLGPGWSKAEVCVVADCGYERDTPRAEQAANARLIAAAPDLLAACRAALEVVAESWADETDLVWHRLRAQLEAAIGRAIG